MQHVFRFMHHTRVYAFVKHHVHLRVLHRVLMNIRVDPKGLLMYHTYMYCWYLEYVLVTVKNLGRHFMTFPSLHHTHVSARDTAADKEKAILQ